MECLRWVDGVEGQYLIDESYRILGQVVKVKDGFVGMVFLEKVVSGIGSLEQAKYEVKRVTKRKVYATGECERKV